MISRSSPRSPTIIVLRDGKMVEHGETRQILKAPRMDYTKALVSVRSIEHEEKEPTPKPLLSVRNVTAACGGGAVKVL
ncbi:hypothetical protein [Mesorhizobium sp.]|uniref:hypothetical protein n=1 Tax=Mesorhizobium sp. TaxID=1871066 RepID=UPI003419AF13